MGRPALRARVLAFALAATPFVVGAAVLLAPGDAVAAKKKKKKKAPKAADKIVIVLAEGPDSEPLEQAVEGALPKGMIVANKKEFIEELIKQGQKGAFGKGLDSSKAREKIVDRIKKSASTTAVDVVVILKVDKTAKGRKVTVLIIDPKLPNLAREDEVTLPAKKPKDQSEDTNPVLASVKPTLESLAPKVEPEEDEEEEAPEEPPPPAKPSRPEGEVDRALVQIHVGVDLGMRRFEFAAPVQTGATCPPEGCKRLRGYNVSGAPMMALGIDLFPLAGTEGLVGGLGLYGAYGVSVGLKSATSGGSPIESSWSHFDIGVQMRIGFGDKPSGNPALYVLVGYGGESFTFTGAGTLTDDVPNVGYRFLRLGLAGRIPVVDRVAVRAGFALLPSLGGGGASSVAGRFDSNVGGGKTSIFGFDLNLAIAVRIAGGLEGAISTRYTRQGYTFDAKNQDAYQASGASEQMIGLIRFGLAYAY